MAADRGTVRPQPGRRAARSRLRGRDGFTLVEVLAAFAILAMLTVFVQRGVVMAKMGLVRADARIAAERVAETLLAEPFGQDPSARGSRSGVADGLRWTVRVEPLDMPAAGGPPPARKPPPAQASAGRAANASGSGNAAATAGSPPPVGGAENARPEETARWRARRVTVEVATAPGRVLEVEAVRLAGVE